MTPTKIQNVWVCQFFLAVYPQNTISSLKHTFTVKGERMFFELLRLDSKSFFKTIYNSQTMNSIENCKN